MAQNPGLHLLKGWFTLQKLCALSVNVRSFQRSASGRVKCPMAHPLSTSVLYIQRIKGKFIISSNGMTGTGCVDLDNYLLLQQAMAEHKGSPYSQTTPSYSSGTTGNTGKKTLPNTRSQTRGTAQLHSNSRHCDKGQTLRQECEPFLHRQYPVSFHFYISKFSPDIQWGAHLMFRKSFSPSLEITIE